MAGGLVGYSEAGIGMALEGKAFVGLFVSFCLHSFRHNPAVRSYVETVCVVFPQYVLQEIKTELFRGIVQGNLYSHNNIIIHISGKWQHKDTILQNGTFCANL